MRTKKHFVIFLTNMCNLRCKHCVVYKGKDSLSLEQLERIREMNPTKVNLMGGEPLLYPKLEKVFEIFSDIPITVQTNGLLVKKFIPLLKKARQIILSLEGMKRNTDAIRGKGVFDINIENVKLLQKEEIPVMLRSSVSRRNLKDVPKLLALAEKMDVPIFFFPELNGGTPLTLNEQTWLFATMQKYEKAWIDLPSFFAFLGKESYCSACESRLSIRADGTITPCQWIDEPIGNVGMPLDVIESVADSWARCKKVVPEECLFCVNSKTCRGGCLVYPHFTGCPQRNEYFSMRLKDIYKQGNVQKQKIALLSQVLKGVVTC